MQKLYLDCDGVILDTINYTYQIIKERGISEDKIDDFYKNLSWETLIEEAGEINNSIEKIKELSKNGQLIKINADIERGFNYPFILYIPNGIDKSQINNLLLHSCFATIFSAS